MRAQHVTTAQGVILKWALLLSDLEEHSRIRARCAGADDRPQRPREAALAADYLADVVRRDMQPEDDGVVPLDRLDVHRRRIVNELAGDPGE